VFRIHLPAAAGRPASVEEYAPQEPVRGGHETILVVEDEPDLRTLVRSILEYSGYSVIEASSGRAALALWPSHRHQVDLLLTDMLMPDGMNGRELALQLKADKPTLRVLYTSGYGTDIMGMEPAQGEALDFLQKPYNPRRLAESVRACLDNASQGQEGAAAGCATAPLLNVGR
jgi:DNA-binding NtrC family response regulator